MARGRRAASSHFHAQTTDRLLVAADNGRVYTLGGDKLPGGRGFGEPIRLTIDLEAESEIVAMFVVQAGMRLLVASSRRARVRDERRGGAGRDAQGQAADQPSAQGEGGGGEAGAGRRGLGRGDRREPQDAGVQAGRAAGAGPRVRACSCSVTATAACPMRWRSCWPRASAGRWAAKAGGSGPRPT